jgi:hypothetical protein
MPFSCYPIWSPTTYPFPDKECIHIQYTTPSYDLFQVRKSSIVALRIFRGKTSSILCYTDIGMNIRFISRNPRTKNVIYITTKIIDIEDHNGSTYYILKIQNLNANNTLTLLNGFLPSEASKVRVVTDLLTTEKYENAFFRPHRFRLHHRYGKLQFSIPY